MERTAKIYLNPDAETLITRVVLSRDGHDSAALPMEIHQSDLQNLLFGQPPRLCFALGVNRDILLCYRCPGGALEYINEGNKPFMIADDDMNCIPLAAHSTRRVSYAECPPPVWSPGPAGGTQRKTRISAEEFLGREMLWDCTLRNVTICYEDALCDWESSCDRPAYWMRGKPVTPQQAFQIIRRTDSIFGALPVWGVPERFPIQVRDFIPLHTLDSGWFSEYHFGWCRPDGRVGVDSILFGCPNARELVLDGIRLLCAFPFLDLVLLVWNSHDTWEFQPMQLETKGMPSIDCGMHLHDNTVELLGGRSAWERFCQYQSDYGEEPLQYWDDYNCKTGKRFVDRHYLDACLTAGGIDFPSQVRWNANAAADVADQSFAAIDLRYRALKQACGSN